MLRQKQRFELLIRQGDAAIILDVISSFDGYDPLVDTVFVPSPVRSTLYGVWFVMAHISHLIRSSQEAQALCMNRVAATAHHEHK